jgi:hypothetical protein
LIVVLIFIISMVYRFLVGPPVDPTLDNNIEKLSVTEVIQINVLNASKVKGLAGEIRDYLRSKGFDVVDVGNYTGDCDSSFVIDRLGDMSSAKKVAFALGIPDSLIFQDIDSSLFLRGTVVIGKNYKTLKPYE